MSLELNESGKEKIQQRLFKKGVILESLLKKNSPVYTSEYRSLWTAQKNDDGTVSVVNPQGEKGRALEFGGGEGNWPPVDELRRWVDRKINPEQSELDSITYLVGRKIFQEGIEMQPHIRPSIREFKNREL